MQNLMSMGAKILAVTTLFTETGGGVFVEVPSVPVSVSYYIHKDAILVKGFTKYYETYKIRFVEFF